MVIEFIKDYARLGSPLTLAVALVIGAIWVWRRRSTAARVYLALLAAGYWFVATPVGAALFMRPLAPHLVRVETREAARGADTIVLLGGGIATVTISGRSAAVPTAASLLRSLEAARVFKAIDASRVIASGGNARPKRQTMAESTLLRRLLVDAGVPDARIIDESSSTTTAEQAAFVRELLRPLGVNRVVVVTSAAHMPRSLTLFRATGLEVVGSMAPMRSEGAPLPPWWLPNAESLSESDDAFYEFGALTYYWMRGSLATR